MKQRVVIAIAISLRPKVIIADEPTSALDVVVQRQVVETLRRVQEEIGASIILVGHDMGLMAQVVDRLGVMYAGTLAEVCDVKAMFREPLHPYSQALIASLPTLDRKGALPRHSRPDAVAARSAARLLLPRALSEGDGALRDRDAAPAGSADRIALSPAISTTWPPRRCRSAREEATMTALLEARHVSKVFGSGLFHKRRTAALDDFSLAIASDPPSITAVVGESGSGKTTLARLLLGLVEPSEGAVFYKGKDLRTLTSAEQRDFRRDVQVIFQDPFEAYNPFYKIDHVLETPVMNFGLATSKAEARGLIEQTLQAVGLRPGGDPRPLSAPAERRAAPADHGGARPAHPPAAHHRRRAGVDGRRLAARHHPRQPAPAPRRIRHFADLRHPRPDDGLPDQPERHRALSRPGRRGGRRRGGGRRAEASLHAAC